MNEDIIKTIDTANKIKKHKMSLQVCKEYLNVLQCNPTETMAYEANQYATEVYKDIQREELEIAVANTCYFPRNVDLVTGVKENLKAAINMLNQVLAKEAKEELDNINEAMR